MLRTVRLALLASIAIYTVFCFRAPVRPEPKPIIFHAITLLSLILVAWMFIFRRRLVKPAEVVLAAQPEDASALTRWRTGYIITWALSEAIAVYGVVLRFIGFTSSQVALFFVAGFALMWWFVPRRPAEVR